MSSITILLICYFTILCAFSKNSIYADNSVRKDVKIVNLYDLRFVKDSLPKNSPHIRTERSNWLSGISSYYEDLFYDYGSPSDLQFGLRRHARGGPRPPPHSGRPNHAGPPPNKGPPHGGFLPHEEHAPHRGPPPHAGPPHDRPPHHGGPPPNRGPTKPKEPPVYEGTTQIQETVYISTATNSYMDVYQNQQNINYFTTTKPTHVNYINNTQGNVLANTSQNDNRVTARPPMYWFQAQAVTPEE